MKRAQNVVMWLSTRTSRKRHLSITGWSQPEGRGMARGTLTDRKIQSLKPRATPYIVPDPQVPGHGVRVLPSGRKSFVLTTRYPGSDNPAPRSLGSYGELTLEHSREKARAWRSLIFRGLDPADQEERDRQAALRKQRTTFAAVAEDFIKDKLPAERKGREVELDPPRIPAAVG